MSATVANDENARPGEGAVAGPSDFDRARFGFKKRAPLRPATGGDLNASPSKERARARGHIPRWPGVRMGGAEPMGSAAIPHRRRRCVVARRVSRLVGRVSASRVVSCGPVCTYMCALVDGVRDELRGQPDVWSPVLPPVSLLSSVYVKQVDGLLGPATGCATGSGGSPSPRLGRRRVKRGTLGSAVLSPAVRAGLESMIVLALQRSAKLAWAWPVVVAFDGCARRASRSPVGSLRMPLSGVLGHSLRFW